jgi:hypothetical protein
MEPWKEEEPPPGTIGYANKGVGKLLPPKTVDPVFSITEGRTRPKYSICTPLGLTGTHPTSICYGNPENP